MSRGQNEQDLAARSPCRFCLTSYTRYRHSQSGAAGKRHLMVASLRYLDNIRQDNGTWLFAERVLYVDWLEERALA
jgi:hypothetical protein